MEDSARLVCALHGRSLRAIRRVTGQHYTRLAQAAYDPSLGLSYHTRMRMMHIDVAFRLYLRLAPSVSEEHMAELDELFDEIQDLRFVTALELELVAVGRRPLVPIGARAVGREARAFETIGDHWAKTAASAAAEVEEQRALPNASAASADAAAGAPRQYEERHTQQEHRRLRRPRRLTSACRAEDARDGKGTGEDSGEESSSDGDWKRQGQGQGRPRRQGRARRRRRPRRRRRRPPREQLRWRPRRYSTRRRTDASAQRLGPPTIWCGARRFYWCGARAAARAGRPRRQEQRQGRPRQGSAIELDGPAPPRPRA